MRQFALLAAVAFAVSSAANAQIVTKYSGIQPTEHPASYTEDYFAQELAALTKGTIKVEVYHNTQLGDAVANVQSIRNGTIGFSTVSTANLNQVVPAMDMYSLPFLFKNEAHFWWFLAQPEAAALAKPLEDKGVKIIAYIDFWCTQFLRPESDPLARRHEGRKDPRHGFAGDDQYHEGARRDWRTSGLGRALHCVADRRRRRCGK